MTAGWKLIIHGGAKEIAPEEEADNRDGLAEAITAGRDVLAGGGTALEAVEASVRVLERLPVFNAGRGSDPTVDGRIEMCAAIMDGATLDIGGVMAIEEVCHPISVARALLRGARDIAGRRGRDPLRAGDGRRNVRPR
jgi:L-asparaginase / beta-aspartyl-peptidase